MRPGQRINHKCHRPPDRPRLVAQNPLARRQAGHLVVASASPRRARPDSPHPPPTLARWGNRSQPLRPNLGFHQRLVLPRPASQDHNHRQPRLGYFPQRPVLPRPARLLLHQRQARSHRLISLGRHRQDQERQARSHRQGQVVLWAVLLSQACQVHFRQAGLLVLWAVLLSRACQERFRSNLASKGHQWERQASRLEWVVPQRHRPKKVVLAG